IGASRFEFDGRPEMTNEAQITWKKTSNVWHVAAIEQTDGRHRYSLRFDDFKPNVPISAMLFHLAALELPPGTSIHDRREHRQEIRPCYQYRPIPDDGTRRFFDMEAELESLATP